MKQFREISLMPLAVAMVFLILTGCEEKDIRTDDVEMNEETGSVSENIEPEDESGLNTDQSVEQIEREQYYGMPEKYCREISWVHDSKYACTYRVYRICAGKG